MGSPREIAWMPADIRLSPARHGCQNSEAGLLSDAFAAANCRVLAGVEVNMDASTSVNGESTRGGARPPKSLSRRILGGGAWSLAGRIGSMGSLFLLNVVVARSLSKGEYSAFLTASSAVPFLSMLATMGAPFTLVRVMRTGAVSTDNRRRMLRGAIELTVIGGVVTAGGYWLTTAVFSDATKWQVLRDYPGLTIGWFTLSALCVVCASYLQADDDFRSAALVGARSGGLIPNGAALIGALVVVWAGWMSLGAVLSIQVLFLLAALAVAAIIIVRGFRYDAAMGVAAATPAADEMGYRPWWYFVESWPNLINQLIGVALVELDLFWIACLADDIAVANYGPVRNLRLLVTAPLLVASISLPPFVAELYGKGDLGRLERVLRATATAVAGPSLVALALLLVFPAAVIQWVYGPDFVASATALQITAVAAIVYVLSGSNAMTLTMTGRHRELMACSVGSLVLYCILSVPLVAAYGVTGAAIAYAIQTIVQNVVVTWRVKREIGIWTIPFCSWSAAREELVRLKRHVRPKT